MKTFVTLFNSDNVHLIKDVGLIPYGMYRFREYDSYIATYKNGEYPHLQDAVNGLKLWLIKRRTHIFIIDAILFLLRHGKQIDVLNLYHTTFQSSILLCLYKVVNPTGMAYVKLDGGWTRESTAWYKRFRHYTMKHADLITTEMLGTKEQLTTSWNRKIELLRNPYNPLDLADFSPYSQRKNIILTVGRLGTPQKNTETLVKAFRKIYRDIPSWNLLLVGPIEDSFQKWLETLFAEEPPFRNRILEYGNVDNRKELMQLYSSSKIFVFPSRFESYGIALMEAGLNGTFSICSNILSSRELTNNFDYSASFPAEDEATLSRLLLKYCTDDYTEIEEKGLKEREFLIKQCSLEEICSQLDKKLNGV